MIMTPKYFFNISLLEKKKEESIPKLYYQVILSDMTFKTK